MASRCLWAEQSQGSWEFVPRDALPTLSFSTYLVVQRAGRLGSRLGKFESRRMAHSTAPAPAETQGDDWWCNMKTSLHTSTSAFWPGRGRRLSPVPTISTKFHFLPINPILPPLFQVSVRPLNCAVANATCSGDNAMQGKKRKKTKKKKGENKTLAS